MLEASACDTGFCKIFTMALIMSSLLATMAPVIGISMSTVAAPIVVMVMVDVEVKVVRWGKCLLCLVVVYVVLDGMEVKPVIVAVDVVVFDCPLHITAISEITSGGRDAATSSGTFV